MAALSRSCVLLSIVAFASSVYKTSACDGTEPNQEIIEGICYSRHGDASKADHKTWNDAKRDCESRQGWLAKMETEAEWEAVRDFIENTIFSGQWVWLGGRGNNRNNMKWGTTDQKVKDTLSSLQWDDRNYGDCLNVNPMQPSGKVLLRNSCGFRKPYICEYAPVPAAQAQAAEEEAVQAVEALAAEPVEEPTVWCTNNKVGFLKRNNLANPAGGIAYYFTDVDQCKQACLDYGDSCKSCDYWPRESGSGICLLNGKKEAEAEMSDSTTAVYNERR